MLNAVLGIKSKKMSFHDHEGEEYNRRFGVLFTQSDPLYSV
jgi:hypothetical protein